MITYFYQIYDEYPTTGKEKPASEGLILAEDYAHARDAVREIRESTDLDFRPFTRIHEATAADYRHIAEVKVDDAK